MKFDKPVVFLTDIPEILSSYSSDSVVESKYLGGVPNTTYRVITPRAKLAIRICNHGYTSIDHLEVEVSLLRHLQAVGFEESPVPIAGIDNKHIQNWRGYRILAMRFIEGTAGDRGVLTQEICQSVGRAIARMQQALSTYEGRIPQGETYEERGTRLLRLLPETAKEMAWLIDAEKVITQWNKANKKIYSFKKSLSHTVIHTDVWPPNIICKKNNSVAIVDFDDWAFGPSFIDIVASLVEFPMFNQLEFDDDLAFALLKGYFANGGQLTDLERQLLSTGMELTCASWLACNALHRIQFEESEIYLQKLQMLRDPQKSKELTRKINQCIDAALEFNHTDITIQNPKDWR